MASGQVDESASEECSVCLNPMVDKSPRALSCLHTFCEPCLKKLAEGARSIVCPTCRETTKLPRTGLRRNFYIKRLAQKGWSEKHCQTCKIKKRSPKTVTSLCTTCHHFMCDQCASRHTVIPAFADHEIIREATKRGVEVMCKKHNKNMSIYCEKCCLFLCDSCALTKEHEGHEDKLKDLMEALAKMKDSMHPQVCSLTAAVTEKLSCFRAGRETLADTERLIKQEAEKKKAQIDDQVKALLKLKQGHLSELINGEQQLSKIQNKLHHLSSVTTLAFIPKDESNLSLLQNINKELLESQQEFNLLPAAISTYTFSPAAEIPVVGQLVKQTSSSSDIARGQVMQVECFECHKKLEPPWFKCGMCPDYKLCVECERTLQNHYWDHLFLKLHKGSDTTAKITWTTDRIFSTMHCFACQAVECDLCPCFCVAPARFYQCGHCDDFILCSQCENEQNTGRRTHDTKHVFIKMGFYQYWRIENADKRLLI